MLYLLWNSKWFDGLESACGPPVGKHTQIICLLDIGHTIYIVIIIKCCLRSYEMVCGHARSLPLICITSGGVFAHGGGGAFLLVILKVDSVLYKEKMRL